MPASAPDSYVPHGVDVLRTYGEGFAGREEELATLDGFLASDFIHEHELGPLLKEAKAGGVRILWIPLRAAAYKETPLKDYQAVSPPNKPLAGMSKADRDEAWVRICAVNP